MGNTSIQASFLGIREESATPFPLQKQYPADYKALTFGITGFLTADKIFNPAIRDSFSTMRGGQTGYIEICNSEVTADGSALEVWVSRIANGIEGHKMVGFRFMGTCQGHFLLEFKVTVWTNRNVDELNLEPKKVIKLELDDLRLLGGFYGEMVNVRKAGLVAIYRLDPEHRTNGGFDLDDDGSVLDELFSDPIGPGQLDKEPTLVVDRSQLSPPPVRATQVTAVPFGGPEEVTDVEGQLFGGPEEGTDPFGGPEEVTDVDGLLFDDADTQVFNRIDLIGDGQEIELSEADMREVILEEAAQPAA
jgi:hypothetical protein